MKRVVCCANESGENPRDITITLIYTFLVVTIYVYLRPNNRARSLSTLVAVDINKDTAHRMLLEIRFAKSE